MPAFSRIPFQPEDFEKHIDSKTKAVYLEAIGNPKYNVADIAGVCW